MGWLCGYLYIEIVMSSLLLTYVPGSIILLILHLPIILLYSALCNIGQSSRLNRHLQAHPAHIMKLVIGGSTGFVGAELVRQALLHPSITSVVGLSRRETPVPQGIDASSASKLKSVACDNFEKYPDAVMSELHGADACIW